MGGGGGGYMTNKHYNVVGCIKEHDTGCVCGGGGGGGGQECTKPAFIIDGRPRPQPPPPPFSPLFNNFIVLWTIVYIYN